jgi:formamidopyrimidine-DNA glycosylase
MPELPELEVVCEVLQRRVVGQTIDRVEVAPRGGPIVVRDLTHEGFEQSLTGASFVDVIRRGKFLTFTCNPANADALYLVVHPKLTGRLQLAERGDKRHAKTHVIFNLSNDRQLRYIDQKTMGQLYLTRALKNIPGYSEMGPEALAITLEEFRERLRPYRGEIKGILTRAEFVAGIGNAYADEILWAARLHPYRKRTRLTSEEIGRLHAAMRSTLLDAIDKARAQMGEAIHLEPRAFLSVHLKTGKACPRCGAAISLVGAHQRVTNFCRACQPGGLIKGM